jgi:hypothetical protein
MLGKLIRHEFRATARTMVPLFLILLAATVCAFFSVGFLKTGVLSVLSALFVFLFFLAIFAAFIMSLVLMIQRFYHNFLTDEGYLMFTLPVSIHSLMWSKLIVSTVWFFATGIAAVLATRISMAQALTTDSWNSLWNNITSTFSSLGSVGYMLECIAALLLGCVCLCLMFYAAMSLGHSFARHKGLWSVLLAIGFMILAQILGLTSLFSWFSADQVQNMSAAAQLHASTGALLAAEVIFGTAFYFITVLSLKKRLNLE